MSFDPATLGIVIGMMVLANRLVAALVTPLFDKLNIDKFWLMYASWLISGVFVWLSGVNLFSSLIPNALIGQILTAIVAGGGGNLLHDLADQKAQVLVANIPDKSEIESITELDK